jgi:predicted DNA-binding transcriptional regulator AlpA
MRYLRFADLKARGIVNNWPTLKRWIEREGFPPGIKLGRNTRAWTEDSVTEWLANRPSWKKEKADT